MEITLFTVSADKTQLDLTINDAADVSALRLWKSNTFKDYERAIDLSSKLTGAATENIIITPTDLGEIYLDGVYFIEAEDTDEVSLAITLEDLKYRECHINNVIENGVCDDCLENGSIPLINSHTMLSALQMAVDNFFIDEIILLETQLKKYCDSCDSCGEYGNIFATDYYTYNDN